LKKSSIENYFHPRAVERFLDLKKNSLGDFKEDDYMVDVINEINIKYGKTFSKKSNINIFELMTDLEFKDVVESELEEFLREICA
jgi:hypothetical protein